jgi:hypothetical protein
MLRLRNKMMRLIAGEAGHVQTRLLERPWPRNPLAKAGYDCFKSGRKSVRINGARLG